MSVRAAASRASNLTSVTRRIVCAADGTPVANEISWARTARERMRGVIGRPPSKPGHALVLDGAHQVHTIGVKHPLDVVFCDDEWNVLHVVRGMRPRRVSRWVSGARYVVELPANCLPPQVTPGTRLELR